MDLLQGLAPLMDPYKSRIRPWRGWTHHWNPWGLSLMGPFPSSSYLKWMISVGKVFGQRISVAKWAVYQMRATDSSLAKNPWGQSFVWVCSSSHLLEQPQEKNMENQGGSIGYPGQGVKNCLFRSTPSTERTKHRTLWVNSFRIEPTLHTPDISPRNFGVWSLKKI